MFKKLSSIVLIGFLTISLSACGKKTPEPVATDDAKVGINVNVGDKKMMEEKKVTDSEKVGVNVMIKSDTKMAPTK